jgi:hypothetical protein
MLLPCFIWRKKSPSAPFSTSSLSAMLGLVIVFLLKSGCWSRNPTLAEIHGGPPRRGASGNQRFASPTASLRADPRRTSYTTAKEADSL